MARPIVVKARYPRKTMRGHLVWYLSIGFAFAWLFGLNAVLLSADLPYGQPPFPLRVLLVGFALVPFVVLIRVPPTIDRRLGLIEALPAPAAMDLQGLSLSIDGVASPLIRWDAIASLESSGRNWRLVGTDGSELAAIPWELMHPPPSWMDAPTFAELVVQLRPDRYALRGGRCEPGLTEFAIRQPNDLVGRPRQVLQEGVVALGIALAVVAFALLIASTPTG